MSSEGVRTTAERDRADVLAWQSGDRDALDALVLRHKDRIYNLCTRLLGDPAEAEECAQETFVKVFRSLKGFRMESSFSTWITTIAVNTCRNRRASSEFRFWRRVLRLGPVPEAEEDDGPVLMDIADDAPSPLTRMADHERDAAVQAAVASLPMDQRTVIVLRYVEELSYDEICRITGYNPGTLKSKLARARMRLHEKLQGTEG